MRTPKEEALELLNELPDDCTLEDIQYRLYVLEKTRKGRADVSQGRSYLNADAKQRLDRWLES